MKEQRRQSSLTALATAGTPVISGGGSTGGGSIASGIGGGKIIAPVVTGTMPSFPSGLNPTGKAIPSGFDVAAAISKLNPESVPVLISTFLPPVS